MVKILKYDNPDHKIKMKIRKLLIDALVAMITGFPCQQDHLCILADLTNKCTKYELHLTSECKLIDKMLVLP